MRAHHLFRLLVPSVVTLSPAAGLGARCAPGTFTDAPGSETCTACAGGTSASGLGNSSCSACAAGSYAPAGSSECTFCSPGSSAPTMGLAECTPCRPGTAAGSSGSIPCEQCVAGTFSTTPASSICSPCPSGTFAGSPGSATCTSCSTCPDGEAAACTPSSDAECLGACALVPATGCRLPAFPGKAKLVIKDTATTNDLLKWTWVKGDATTLADFGDPAGGTCAGKPCWKAKSTGFRYKDKELTPDGALVTEMKAGIAGKASIGVTAKGAHLETPNPSLFTGPIQVQLQRTDAGGTCFEAVYSAPFEKNAGGKFADAAD